MIEIQLEDVEIRPKARPRAGKGRIYQPGRSDECTLGWLMFEYCYKHYSYQEFLFKSNVKIEIEIRKKAVRGDIDNYLKTVLDALQKSSILSNDKLVKECYIKLCKSDTNRLIIKISKLGPGT